MTLYTRSNLESLGFVGWASWHDIANCNCPTTGGAYVIHYSCEGSPIFVHESPVGWFTGKDPTVPIDALRANWVDGVDVIYIGKAGRIRHRILWRLACSAIELGTERKHPCNLQLTKSEFGEDCWRGNGIAF